MLILLVGTSVWAIATLRVLQTGFESDKAIGGAGASNRANAPDEDCGVVGGGQYSSWADEDTCSGAGAASSLPFPSSLPPASPQ